MAMKAAAQVVEAATEVGGTVLVESRAVLRAVAREGGELEEMMAGWRVAMRASIRAGRAEPWQNSSHDLTLVLRCAPPRAL